MKFPRDLQVSGCLADRAYITRLILVGAVLALPDLGRSLDHVEITANGARDGVGRIAESAHFAKPGIFFLNRFEHQIYFRRVHRSVLEREELDVHADGFRLLLASKEANLLPHGIRAIQYELVVTIHVGDDAQITVQKNAYCSSCAIDRDG